MSDPGGNLRRMSAPSDAADHRAAGLSVALAAQLAAAVADRTDNLTPDRKVQLAQVHAQLAVVDELGLLRDVLADVGEQLRRVALLQR